MKPQNVHPPKEAHLRRAWLAHKKHVDDAVRGLPMFPSKLSNPPQRRCCFCRNLQSTLQPAPAFSSSSRISLSVSLTFLAAAMVLFTLESVFRKFCTFRDSSFWVHIKPSKTRVKRTLGTVIGSPKAKPNGSSLALFCFGDLLKRVHVVSSASGNEANRNPMV